jgi:hypothetical protein
LETIKVKTNPEGVELLQNQKYFRLLYELRFDQYSTPSGGELV